MPSRYHRSAGALAGLAIAGLMQLSSGRAAFAAQNESPTGWELAFDSYLWVSSVTGTTSTSNPNIPTSKSTISFGSLFSHLNSVPIIGAFEARNGRFGVLTDLMVISLSGGSSSNGEAFSGGSAKLTELISTILPNYRVFQGSGQTVDVGIGVRTFAFWTKLTLDPGTEPGFSRSATLAWADPIFALRYRVALTDRLSLTAYGDVGATGSTSTWQVWGTLNYRVYSWMTLQTGYRYLNFDNRNDLIDANTALSGPILGATIKF